jgi:hypothetical protein
MNSVSHKSRRTPRPWTAQDQITAEVAAACGVSLCEIGRTMDRDGTLVKERLIAAAAESRRARSRRWRQENPDKHLENNRRWRQENSDEHREYCRCWIRDNPDKSRINARRWKHKNPDKCRESKRARDVLERTGRRQSVDPVTLQQIDARFAIWKNRCAFCGVAASDPRNHGRKRLTVEHVLAITKGGLDEASNIIPACTSCNSSKHNNPVETWYRRQPFFSETRWRKIQRHCPAAVVGQLPLAL